jgi:DHA1 family bicyclomycin/chloramphenicol resistance-like MFS transporter
VFAAAILVWTSFQLPETRAVATGEGFDALPRRVRQSAHRPRFLGYALVAAFNSAMFFTFIGGAPHVVVTIMHRSSAEYGIWFLVISLAYMAGISRPGAGRRSTASTS